MPNLLSQRLHELQIPSDDRVFIYPNIPLKKSKNAINSYGNSTLNHDQVIILIDETLFGSAKEGIFITNDSMYIKRSFIKPIVINFKDIRQIHHNSSKLFINGEEIIDCCMPSKSTCEILYCFLEKLINENNNMQVDLNKTIDNYEDSLDNNNPNDLKQLENNALQGNIDAQYNLGRYYFERREIKGNIDKAFYWFDKVAENSNAEIQYEIGVCYDLCDNEDRAFYWYKKAAEKGNKEAQQDLGIAFMLGKGTEPDEFEGHKWFKRAVENGNIDAMWGLGKSFLDGNGTEQNYEKAFYWFRKGAEKGDPMAQNSLGICYLKARGTTKDDKKAFYWVKKAAEQGERIAQGNLGDYYRKGTGTAINMNEAYFWYQKAAEQGDDYSVKALNKYFSHNGMDEELTIVKEVNKDNSNIQVKDESNFKLPETTKASSSQRAIRIRTNPQFSDKLFKPIALLGGYAIIIVALLRNNAADKILTLLSKMPGIGILGIMGKVALKKPLEWLSEQFVNYGEQFIMERLVYSWQNSGIGYDDLLNKINTVPSFIIEEQIIDDSKMLLEKYYN